MKRACDLEWLSADSDAVSLPLEEAVTVRVPNGRMRVQQHAFDGGLRLYDTRVRSDRPLTIRPQTERRDPFVATMVALTGRCRMHLPDGARATMAASQGSFFRAPGHDALFEIDGPRDLHHVGVSADLPVLAHWFGPRLPPDLRPYLADEVRLSQVAALPVPAVRAAAAGLLDLPYRGDLRAMMMEGIALQMMAGFLDALCGNDTSEAAIGSRERKAALEAHARLLDDMRAPPTAGELARAVGLSVRRLDRSFRELFGGSVVAVLRRERLEHALLALRRENLPVKTVAWRVGYDHVANFSRAFQRQFGVTPTAARGRRRS